MRYEIRSIGIWTLIKVGFFLNLILGFLLGLFSSLIIIPMARMMMAVSGVGEIPMEEEGTSIGLLIFLPFFWGIFAAFFNTLFMVIVAACYNLVARVVGGLEFTFKEQPTSSLLQVAPIAAAPPMTPIYPAQAHSTPPPSPYRTVQREEGSQAIAPVTQLPDELPVKIPQAEASIAEIPPVENSVDEPSEDGPRRDNP